MYICYKIGRASLANLGVETSVLEFGIRNIKSPLPQELEQQNLIYHVIFWQHCHVWQIVNSVRTSTIPMTSKLGILVTYGRWSHLPSHVNFWASRHVRNYYFYIVFLYSCEYIQHKKQQKYSPVQSKAQLFWKFQVIEWNRVDENIRNSKSLNIFKKSFLKFIRSSGSTVFNCHNPKGIYIFTWLKPGLSHLCKHKFKNGFQDSLSLIWSCGKDIETLTHFFLDYPYYSNEISTFLNKIGSIDRNILTRSEFQVTDTLHNGDSNSNNVTNTLILNATIYFLIVTEGLMCLSFRLNTA